MLQASRSTIIVAMGDRVALLFTDIEGSTRMLERLGERYEKLQAEHDRLMREGIAAGAGV